MILFLCKKVLFILCNKFTNGLMETAAKNGDVSIARLFEADECGPFSEPGTTGTDTDNFLVFKYF